MQYWSELMDGDGDGMLAGCASVMVILGLVAGVALWEEGNRLGGVVCLIMAALCCVPIFRSGRSDH